MRTLKLIGAAVLVLVLATLGSVYGLLRASLPQLDGRIEHAKIGAPVRIARDARGVPTIEAADRLDLAFASGFVHAQDRFFQMDLSRRLARGNARYSMRIRAGSTRGSPALARALGSTGCCASRRHPGARRTAY